MIQVRQSSQFKKDIKRSQKRNLDLSKLKLIVHNLANNIGLSPSQKDHKLGGDWVGYRECHIAPDWLLIYKHSKQELLLVRTGTHADLFNL